MACVAVFAGNSPWYAIWQTNLSLDVVLHVLGVWFEQHVLPCMQCCAHHASVFHHTLLLAAQAVVFSTPESVGPGRKIRSTSQRMQCSAHSILLSYMALFS